MTDLRKAAEDLLEVVEAAIKAGDWKVDGACDLDLAIVRLRQALAQPDEVLAEREACAKAAEAVLEAWDWDWSEPRNEALKERMEALRQALAQPEWVGLNLFEQTHLRTTYAPLKILHHDIKEDISVAAEVVADWGEFFAAIEAKLKEKNT